MGLRIPIQIQEFLSAARKSYSYNIFRNIYIWFGIFWGLPIPLVTLFLEIHFSDANGVDQILQVALTSPIQLLFLLHPLIFGIIFGIMGTIRAEKDKALTSTISRLRDMVIHDPLTGLKNRRYFSHIFHDESARSLRHDEPITLLFLDIDHFKQINDTYGHYTGDVVLKELGRYLNSMCRPYDTAVRWGGEEFLILLCETDESGAANFAERIRRGIEAGFSAKVEVPVTISIGIAEYEHNDTLELLTDRADQALYLAKKNGRNRTVSWSMLQQEKNGGPETSS